MSVAGNESKKLQTFSLPAMAKKQTGNEKLSGMIAPQFIYFDSLGNCTFHANEHKFFLLSPSLLELLEISPE